MFESALAAWRSGRYAEAEAACRALLAATPTHAGALHLLGALALQHGRAAEAEALLRQALAACESAVALTDLGIALRAQGRVAEARTVLRRAVALDEPASPGRDAAAAHFHLATTLDPTEAAEAEAHLRRALALQPELAEAHNNLGNLLRERDPVAAEAAFRRAVALQPRFAQAHFNLGTLLAATEAQAAETALRHAVELAPGFAAAWHRLGRLLAPTRPAEAEAALRHAIALAPDLAAAHFHLGNLLSETRPAEAETALRHAMALKPDCAAVYNNLGHVLAATRPDEAEAAIRRALALDPGLADAHYNLGSLLAQRRPAEAAAALQRAVELRPDFALAWYNLGNVLANAPDDVAGERRLDRAETALRRALALQPDLACAHATLGNVLLDGGRLDEAIAGYRRALALDPDCAHTHSDLVFALAFQTDDAHAVLAECRRFAARHEAPYLARPLAHANDRTPERRLRIGYVSPDFRYHCQSLFTVPLLAHHDPAAFEIVGYASVAAPDDMTRRLAALTDVWRDVHALDDERLAQTIRADRIDILVDLTMHMAGGRRLLFARRPAPVQVAWLAYPGTTGSPAMDYRLTDPWLDPPEQPVADARYSERSMRLPDAFWCYDAQARGLGVNVLPALQGAPFTFGCLNNPAKLTDHTLRLWAAALAGVAGARLLLLAPEGRARERLAARCAAHGLDAARIEFVGFQLRRHYLATWRRIDLALDTFPYNGHTTSLDAFWMGVPVVTRVGRPAPSRGGLSLAANLGLREELAATTDEDFARLAIRLAHDLPRLAALRAGLRARMAASPLMDGARFARHIEAAYREMWREWCRRDA